MNLWSNPEGEALANRIHAEAVRTQKVKEQEPREYREHKPYKARRKPDLRRQRALVARMIAFPLVDIAKAAGIDVGTVGRIRRGQSYGNAGTLTKIANALKILEAGPLCCPMCGK